MIRGEEIRRVRWWRTPKPTPLVAATGQIPWPPGGSFLSATGQFLLAIDRLAAESRTAWPEEGESRRLGSLVMTNQLRLSLGSGQKSVPGWVCIDGSPNVVLSRMPLLKAVLNSIGVLFEAHMAGWDREIVRADIRSLPYADGQVDAVYSSPALERLYLEDAHRVLAELSRILAPGRMLRLALPDATEIAPRLLASVDDPPSGCRYNESSCRIRPREPVGYGPFWGVPVVMSTVGSPPPPWSARCSTSRALSISDSATTTSGTSQTCARLSRVRRASSWKR